jgi:hypothetical protein
MDQIIADVVASKDQLDNQLNMAAGIAMECAAQDKRHGVLVTRHDFSRFTAALSSTVPFGLIQEHDLLAGA